MLKSEPSQLPYQWNVKMDFAFHAMEIIKQTIGAGNPHGVGFITEKNVLTTSKFSGMFFWFAPSIRENQLAMYSLRKAFSTFGAGSNARARPLNSRFHVSYMTRQTRARWKGNACKSMFRAKNVKAWKEKLYKQILLALIYVCTI